MVKKNLQIKAVPAARRSASSIASNEEAHFGSAKPKNNGPVVPKRGFFSKVMDIFFGSKPQGKDFEELTESVLKHDEKMHNAHMHGSEITDFFHKKKNRSKNFSKRSKKKKAAKGKKRKRASFRSGAKQRMQISAPKAGSIKVVAAMAAPLRPSLAESVDTSKSSSGPLKASAGKRFSFHEAGESSAESGNDLASTNKEALRLRNSKAAQEVKPRPGQAPEQQALIRRLQQKSLTYEKITDFDKILLAVDELGNVSADELRIALNIPQGLFNEYISVLQKSGEIKVLYPLVGPVRLLRVKKKKFDDEF